ncbi:MAG: tetratricopeptide repeat protein [Planctomycetaceae bacterium]|nr:tetratricopeptide repeat protein [Planctomycetaceae bacterium]
MPNTTLRLLSDRYRTKGPGDPLRRWLAIFLALAAIVAASYIFSRDVNWQKRAEEARQLGITAYRNGNYELARGYYETALANHPYDWVCHLNLADLLFRRLDNPDGALRHYLLSLAYSPEPSINEEVRESIDIIRLMRTGELEDPRDALNDMFMAVDTLAMPAFMRRLSIELGEDRLAYWNAWRARGPGTITRVIITSNHNGFYDAFVELHFEDGTDMSMHLICPLRDIWRLELSFP